MVHWQSDTTAIVLLILSGLHFGLIRSDCSARDSADIAPHCPLDDIDYRRNHRYLNEERSEGYAVDRVDKNRLDSWRADLQRSGLCFNAQYC